MVSSTSTSSTVRMTTENKAFAKRRDLFIFVHIISSFLSQRVNKRDIQNITSFLTKERKKVSRLDSNVSPVNDASAYNSSFAFFGGFLHCLSRVKSNDSNQSESNK